MSRIIAILAGVAPMVVATTLFLTGCGTIYTGPLPSASVKLTPNPPVILVAPFDKSTGKWLVGRQGVELVEFKQDFQTNFVHQLVERLTKIAPSEPRWKDNLPDHGW